MNCWFRTGDLSIKEEAQNHSDYNTHVDFILTINVLYKQNEEKLWALKVFGPCSVARPAHPLSRACNCETYGVSAFVTEDLGMDKHDVCFSNR
ncbi:hypothetical protein Hanom_Chr00s000005g01612791 [Helianthus anomalus]